VSNRPSNVHDPSESSDPSSAPRPTSSSESFRPPLANKFGVAFLFLGIEGAWSGRISRGLSAYLICVGALLVAGVVIGWILRDSAHDGTGYRVPRRPRASRWLTFHFVHSIWLEAGWLAFTLTALPLRPDKTPWWIWAPVVLVAVPVSRFVLANRTLLVVKQCIDRNFRIVHLRRFSSESAHVSRAVIAPILGAYGRLLSVRDETLLQAKAGFNADSEAVLGEVYETAKLDDDEWKPFVADQLFRADLVVFDWPGAPTPAMKWEFHEAERWVHPERMLWFTRDVQVDPLRAWLKDHARVELRAPRIVVFPKEADASNLKMRELRDYLHDFLSNLRRIPRARVEPRPAAPASRNEKHTCADRTVLAQRARQLRLDAENEYRSGRTAEAFEKLREEGRLRLELWDALGVIDSAAVLLKGITFRGSEHEANAVVDDVCEQLAPVLSTSQLERVRQQLGNARQQMCSELDEALRARRLALARALKRFDPRTVVAAHFELCELLRRPASASQRRRHGAIVERRLAGAGHFAEAAAVALRSAKLQELEDRLGARAALDRAAAHADRSADSPFIAELLDEWCNSAAMREAAEAVEPRSRRALEFAKQHENWRIVFNQGQWLAATAARRGDDLSALTWLETARSAAVALQSPVGAGWCDMGLARTLARMGRRAEAKERQRMAREALGEAAEVEDLAHLSGDLPPGAPSNLGPGGS
jgi:hypothetical protein